MSNCTVLVVGTDSDVVMTVSVVPQEPAKQYNLLFTDFVDKTCNKITSKTYNLT